MADQDMDDDRDNTPSFFHHKTSNKVLFTAVISLSSVVILVTLFHIFVRCVLRRQARRRRAALGHLRLYTTTAHEPSKTGLDPTVIASLPMFIFKPEDEAPTRECAVCISVLEDGEMVRILPNCKHNFHAECIDNWLSTNSTCPICRTEAEPQPVVESSELAGGVPPTAPPLESVGISNEGTSEGAAAKVIGSSSSSRLSSFRKMLSRERSSQRIQSRTQEGGVEDLERQ